MPLQLRRRTRQGRYQTRRGDVYVGELWPDRGWKHGKGTLTTASIKYKGGWRRDQRYGFGIQTWTTGHTYQGSWVGDTMHGQGTMTWPDGSTYCGDWVRNQRQGRGVWKTPRHEEWYHGQWFQDQRHGVATWYYWGHVYIGDVRCNVPHGMGRCTARDGWIYDGTWDKGACTRGTTWWRRGEQHDIRQRVPFYFANNRRKEADVSPSCSEEGKAVVHARETHGPMLTQASRNVGTTKSSNHVHASSGNASVRVRNRPNPAMISPHTVNNLSEDQRRLPKPVMAT